jgi:hypothetical protein
MLTFKLNNELINIQLTICYNRKNLQFSSRTNLIKTRCMPLKQNENIH